MTIVSAIATPILVLGAAGVMAIIALITTPFVYNPLAFTWSSIVHDLSIWQSWVTKRGLDGKGAEGGKTWAAWWEEVQAWMATTR